MRIFEFRAQNVKNLKVIEIKPDKNAVILTGKNGTGKSSVLDCILMALAGKKIEKPIREGQDRAEVNMDLGQFRVKKVWTAAGERLEVSNPEGAKYSSPQALLNKILGELSFDPLSFKGMEPKEQRELLLKVVGLDLSKFDTKHEALYNDRTIVNREFKSLSARLAATPEPAVGLPEQEISLKAELEKIAILEKKENQYRAFLGNISAEQEKISNLRRTIKELELEAENIRIKLRQTEQALKDETEYLKQQSSNPPEKIISVDISLAKDELAKVEITNSKIRAAHEYSELKELALTAEAEANTLTKQIEELERQKIESVKACKFPIVGLGVSDTAVLCNGIPFNQLSTGQQVGISTAIAMALNPKLKIILVREGASLDNDGRAAIIKMAKDKDYQIWVECIDDKAGVGIHLEDGNVVAVDGKPIKMEEK